MVEVTVEVVAAAALGLVSMLVDRPSSEIGRYPWRTCRPHHSGTGRCGLESSGVKFFVRWAEGKRLSDHLPDLSPITPRPPPGTDRIVRVDAPPHAVPFSWDPEAFSRFLT